MRLQVKVIITMKLVRWLVREAAHAIYLEAKHNRW